MNFIVLKTTGGGHRMMINIESIVYVKEYSHGTIIGIAGEPDLYRFNTSFDEVMKTIREIVIMENELA